MVEYTIIKDLAKGGQKQVRLAELTDGTGTRVVVKESLISSSISLQRMVREFSLLRQLDSPYFPKNYDAGFDMTSMTLTIVEEYIEGETLANRSHDYTDWSSISDLLLRLIDGMEVVWKNNIVHRDLKPANIIIRPDGSPCIIDFGIARFLDMESLTNTLSPSGPRTPLYASPEQMRNDKHLIDMRTDFFALGIVAMELFLGVHPFDPSIVNNSGLTVIDNLKDGKYAICTSIVQEDARFTELSKHLLQQQAYMRPRDYNQFRQLIKTLCQ